MPLSPLTLRAWNEWESVLHHGRPHSLVGQQTHGFGRVEKGMEVVQKMSLAKVNKKNDKPYDDVNIISITVK